MIDNKEVLQKEIDLIQSCINRMAQNSFMIRGWAISLVAVVLALLPKKVDIITLSVLGMLATLCFWYLDAFFVKMERLYRWKYEWVITNRLQSNENFYDLNPYNSNMWCLDNESKEKKEPRILRIMFTKTLTPIYFILCILSLIVLAMKIVG